jgi:hypothetical protein
LNTCRRLVLFLRCALIVSCVNSSSRCPSLIDPFSLVRNLALFRAFFFLSSLQTPHVAFFIQKRKIALRQLPILHVLPKNLVLIPPPRPAIGTSKIRRIRVQPCKSTQTDHHCQAKTDACPSARSLTDIQGHFYTHDNTPSPKSQPKQAIIVSNMNYSLTLYKKTTNLVLLDSFRLQQLLSENETSI